MAKKPETVLKEKVLADLKEVPGVYVRKIQQVSLRGTLDLMVCVAGNFVAIELKANDNEDLDDLQKHEASKILKAGGYVFKVTPMTWPGVLSSIKRMAYFEAKTASNM